MASKPAGWTPAKQPRSEFTPERLAVDVHVDGQSGAVAATLRLLRHDAAPLHDKAAALWEDAAKAFAAEAARLASLKRLGQLRKQLDDVARSRARLAAAADRARAARRELEHTSPPPADLGGRLVELDQEAADADRQAAALRPQLDALRPVVEQALQTGRKETEFMSFEHVRQAAAQANATAEELKTRDCLGGLDEVVVQVIFAGLLTQRQHLMIRAAVGDLLDPLPAGD